MIHTLSPFFENIDQAKAWYEHGTDYHYYINNMPDMFWYNNKSDLMNDADLTGTEIIEQFQDAELRMFGDLFFFVVTDTRYDIEMQDNVPVKIRVA